MRIEPSKHRTTGSLDAPFNGPMIQCSDNSISRAFTLIELMVVLVVIAILAGILMMALTHVVSGGKANQTRATLATLRGMLTEYENATHFQNAPAAWEWEESSTGTIRQFTSAIGYDFWRTPYNNTSGTQACPDPLMAPGMVVQGQNDRFGSIAVIDTQIVMGILSALPVNKTVLAKMGTNMTMVLPRAQTSDKTSVPTGGELNNGSNTRMLANLPDNTKFDVFLSDALQPPSGRYAGALNGTDGNSKGSVSSKSNPVQYVEGVEVEDNTGGAIKYYRYTGIALGNNSAAWTATSTATPVLLDGWQNPIIFVPGSGLLVWSKSQGTTSGTNIYVKPVLIQSPDHKPFFASAGPDGDFSNGDDNIYSFEQ